MKNNPENIPSGIFDRLEKSDFSSLTSDQQAEVLAYFSREEYEELHQNAVSIKAFGLSPDEHSHDAVKQRLLLQFDEMHRKPKSHFALFTLPASLWKAAAIITLFGSGWLCHHLIPLSGNSSGQLMAAIDTIYVRSEIEPAPVKIYDTMYIDREPSLPGKIRHYHRSRGNRVINNKAAYPDGEINVLSIDELKSTPNRQKRNSLKDDSLIKKYSLTTL